MIQLRSLERVYVMQSNEFAEKLGLEGKELISVEAGHGQVAITTREIVEDVNIQG